MDYITIYPVITSYDEDIQIYQGTDGKLNETEDAIDQELIVESFKNERDRKIIRYLLEGYNFSEISRIEKLKHSEIYEIKKELAINKFFRPTFRKLVELEETRDMLFVYIFAHGYDDLYHIYRNWESTQPFSDYRRPDAETLVKWVTGITKDIISFCTKRSDKNKEVSDV